VSTLVQSTIWVGVEGSAVGKGVAVSLRTGGTYTGSWVFCDTGRLGRRAVQAAARLVATTRIRIRKHGYTDR